MPNAASTSEELELCHDEKVAAAFARRSFASGVEERLFKHSCLYVWGETSSGYLYSMLINHILGHLGSLFPASININE